MPYFSARTLDTVRDKILEVAGEFTVLKFQAGRHWGLTPFKTEKTPSFTVIPNEQRFYCYSEKKGGDAITLVEELLHLDFADAVEYICSRHNIPIEYDSAGPDPQRSMRKEIFDIHEAAMDYFRGLFRTGKFGGAVAKNYFHQKRGFSESTAEEFQIGFAPTNDNFGLARLLIGQFDQQALRSSGIFYCPPSESIKRPDQLKLRWSGRLMIPIHDQIGRICGFTGRQVPEIMDISNASEAKYVNSPETPVFQKGSILFNLHRAQKEIRQIQDKRFVLVEGQLDVMRMWEVGVKYAIGAQGTAIQAQQLKMIGGNHGARCLLDGDSAGLKAAVKVLELTIANECDIVFNLLPPKNDPDLLFIGLPPDLAESRFKTLCSHEFTPIGFAVHLLIPRSTPDEPGNAIARAEATRTIINFISKCPSPLGVWCLIEELAHRLKIDPQPIWSEYLLDHKLPAVPNKPDAPQS